MSFRGRSLDCECASSALDKLNVADGIVLHPAGIIIAALVRRKLVDSKGDVDQLF
jgi:hypothetical protein